MQLDELLTHLVNSKIKGLSLEKSSYSTSTDTLYLKIINNIDEKIYKDAFFENIKIKTKNYFNLSNVIIEVEKIDSLEKDIDKDSASKNNENDIVFHEDLHDLKSNNELKSGYIRENKEQNIVYSEPIVLKKEEKKPVFGKEITDADLKKIVDVANLKKNNKSQLVKGKVFDVEFRDTKTNLVICTFQLEDGLECLKCKIFIKDKNSSEYSALKSLLKDERNVVLKGIYEYDEVYDRDYLFRVNAITEISLNKQYDTSDEKRIELFCQTNMSLMSSLINCEKLADIVANNYGYSALGVVDLNSVQAFPTVYNKVKAINKNREDKLKLILGVEMSTVFDNPIIYVNNDGTDITSMIGNYTVFDVETTGLSQYGNQIIEFGAVRIENGREVAEFSEFVNPGSIIPEEITEITGIKDEDVKYAEGIEVVLKNFLDFAKGSIFVAHNASFDMSFIRNNCKKLGYEFNDVYIDTLNLARSLYPNLSKYNLKSLTKFLDVELINAHRAKDDSRATSHVFLKLLKEVENKGVKITEVNDMPTELNIGMNNDFSSILMIKKQCALKYTYELISKAHMNYFYRTPKIPFNYLKNRPDGLLIGTGHIGSELLLEVSNEKSIQQLSDIASKYDFIVLEPPKHWKKSYYERMSGSREHYIQQIKLIYDIAQRLGKPVVVGAFPRYIDKNDYLAKNILENYKSQSYWTDSYDEVLMNTEELIEDFKEVFGDDTKKIVINNPKEFIQDFENVIPVPEGTFTPPLENAEQNLKDYCYEKAHSIYGENLPEVVSKRLEKELNSIISNGYAALYIIAKQLVEKSLDDGYIVGSRGSVGSSFAANMSGITEVNPLVPHYVCPKCKHSEFFENSEYESGVDLPDKICPKCSTEMNKCGHNIPFEVFLGFNGDKEPDIDLNFAGEYMSRIHKFTDELFGSGYVFRAGTIGEIKKNTALSYLVKYKEQPYAKDEIIRQNRAKDSLIVRKIVGVKRTTGQHAGGLMIVPRQYDIHDFCPIQYPADKKDSGVITTHFKYKDLSGKLLKLDELGHNGPSIIKALENLTGINPQEINLQDKGALSIFTTTDALNIQENYKFNGMGTLGIPEFGTNFVRGMLESTKPSTFAELVRISGLSHGTNVWKNNVEDLVKEGITDLQHAICTRDDIMIYLISKGMDKLESFLIMEDVRKGKGLKPEYVQHMKDADVPNWYIDSCNKIEYMFPKAHAVAYVLLSVRIAYFKVHYPAAFYASTFSQKLSTFNTDMLLGNIPEIEQMYVYNSEQAARDKKDKFKDTLPTLELIDEMLARGLKFGKVDLYKSSATEFLVLDDKTVLPPLSALSDISELMALSIVEEREKSEFISKEDFKKRVNINKKGYSSADTYGLLDGLSEQNQLSFF